MDVARDVVSWAFLMTGGFFALVGALGIIRLPDVFARMHGAGMVDTLGAGLILVGLAIQAGFTLVTVKIFLILAFFLFTSPTSTHALARAVILSGIQPFTGKEGDKGDDPSKT